MTKVDFQVLENRYEYSSHQMVHETWFISRRRFLRKPQLIRRELYKFENGSVVAFRDSGVGVDNSLYVDADFFDLYNGEQELHAILTDQGIATLEKLKLFRMEDAV